MFCPKCGTAEQQPETFCRKCGTFLPDFARSAKREKPAGEHIKANMVLSSLTVATSFTLAALLYSILGFRTDTPVLIYLTAGFLIAIGGWHIQTLIRTLMLRKQLRRWGRLDGTVGEDSWGEAPQGSPALAEPDLSSHVPTSVTDLTTKNLTAMGKRSS